MLQVNRTLINATANCLAEAYYATTDVSGLRVIGDEIHPDEFESALLGLLAILHKTPVRYSDTKYINTKTGVTF